MLSIEPGNKGEGEGGRGGERYGGDGSGVRGLLLELIIFVEPHQRREEMP